jgi:PleD family two-component response regulator
MTQILIIDEDTRELRKLREILAREGYDIMTATDRRTAEEISRKVPVSFVLGTSSALGFTKSS